MKESEHGSQLGAITQKNAQIRIDLKRATKRASEAEADLEKERSAYAALRKATEKQLLAQDDGDRELAELDANVSRRLSKAHDHFGHGMVSLTATPSTPVSIARGTPSPVESNPRSASPPKAPGPDALHAEVHGAAAKPGGCCSMS